MTQPTDDYGQALGTVPCDWCGRSTTFTQTRRCQSCWSIERGFDIMSVEQKQRVFARLRAVLEAEEL